MATGGATAADHDDDRRESLTCSLCLHVFNQPKLLPCYHTFCLNCLRDLTSRLPSTKFPCPQCRREVTTPPGGVAAFQSNFYIRPEDLDVARKGLKCLTHPKQDLDLYCVDCQQPLCLKCVLTKHKQHSTKDLSEADREARTQLDEDRSRLQMAVIRAEEQLEAAKRDQQTLQDREAAIETEILRRHALVIAEADEIRDHLLQSLNTARGEGELAVAADLQSKEEQLQKLKLMQQQLEDAISKGTGCQLLTAAKSMRSGWGSPQALSKMTSEERSDVSLPSISPSKATLHDISEQLHCFMGEPMTGLKGSLTKVESSEDVSSKCSSQASGEADAQERKSQSPYQRTVTLKLDAGRLGLHIFGGRLDVPIYVRKIEPSKAADVNGQLRVGDQIVSVNGHNLETATLGEASKVLRNLGTTVTLVIQYSVSTQFTDLRQGKLR